MPIVRLTAFFKDDDGHGWSETHDIDGGSGTPNLTTILTNFNNLMTGARRNLLAGDAFYIGCRASYTTPNGTIAGDNIELDPPLRGPQTFGGAQLGMSSPEAAVKLRLKNAASTARKDIYIRGMWSQVINLGVLDFGSTPAAAEWKRRADIYGNALISGGYGWNGTDPANTSRGKAGPYTTNSDGTVTMQVAATNGINLPANGTRLPCKFARLNASKSIMNRAFTCVTAGGGAQLITTEKVSPSAYETAGTYIATVKALIPYAALSYYKLARRKTGRPFGVGPGRLRAATLH